MKRKKNKSVKSETENESQIETSFYRLILVGDNEVGKTQIINKYINNIYKEDYLPTYSIDFQIKTTKINGKLKNIHCIDTQGSSDFSQDTGIFFIQKSDAFIYVFDITSRESLYNLNNYYEIIKLALTDSQKLIKEKVVYLVGNKCDLMNRQVNEYEGRLEAKKYEAKYLEVSAKTGINIDKLFDYIIQDIIREDYNSNIVDSGGEIIHKNIFNKNNTNNIDNNINTNNNNIQNNINTNSNIIENEKSGLFYDDSTYHLKSNMSVNNNNGLINNINNVKNVNNKNEMQNSNFFPNKCQIF